MSQLEQVVRGMLTVQEAARELGLQESTLRAWLLRRKIGFVKLGRSVRIPRAVVERLIDENTIPARGGQR